MNTEVMSNKLWENLLDLENGSAFWEEMDRFYLIQLYILKF